MSGELKGLLSEWMRPGAFSDLTLSGDIIGKLQRMLETKAPINMVLRGPSGTGKTSAARIMLQGWEVHDKLIINGAKDTGINYIRDGVAGFASSPFRTEELRLCFIDEADHLSSQAQASLQVLIEQSSYQCRFILALNDISRLAAALRSRLFTIDFTVRPAKAEEITLQLQNRYSDRLKELGVSFDRGTLDDIVTLYSPDFRRIANALEFEFCT